ncbi:MAG TPA: hypothetical protein VHK03_09485 [Aestuariivirgaceae bacterium]|jgi:hypothetical protein|nr:hypothetical protein [Aestuariivirgaceae bacterium]
MTFIPPCCAGSTEQPQPQHGTLTSLSKLLRAVFCSCADKAGSLEDHAGKAACSSESSDPDLLPEESHTEAEQEKPLDEESARRLAEKFKGDFDVTQQ